MTLAQIRTMLTNFVGDTGFYKNYAAKSPTSVQLVSQINWAIRTFSEYTWCCYDPKITFTLTAGTYLYDCRKVTSTAVVSRKVLEPITVAINGNMLMGPDDRPGLWSLKDLERIYPGYQTYDNGVPARAVWLPGNKLLLSSPPDTATAAASNHFISGPYLAADLVDSTDDNNSPDIPEEAHEMLAYFAAWRAVMPSITEGEGWQKVAAYRGDWKEMADQMRSQNRQAILGPSQIRGMDNEWMCDTLWI